MANDPTYEFPLPQDSYAAFDAISLRNLIIQRLNDQGIVTDQNYIGSNLASIIDIISFSFNTLIYYLNKTSTESTFTEAQIYENISRIVKVLDYKPIGYQTSSLAFSCSANDAFLQGVYTIPRYSYILPAGIPFSFNEDITFSVTTDNQITPLSDLSNKKLLYQGTFRETPIHTATGEKNEVVTINVSNAQIDHFNIHVYVYEKTQLNWVQYKEVPNLYTEQSLARAFEKKLNSNLLYEITFGDGINGRKLELGERVIIYFLQSSGTAGVIGPEALKNAFSRTLFSTPTFTQILNTENVFRYINSDQFKNIIFDNITGSTFPKNIENADSIRKNAPANFKSQYRLVTSKDYESFIKINFDNFISDVKIFSNWDYTGKYLKYFYEMGLNPGGFQQILLNQVLYADSCNFNNVYVCAIPRISKGSSLKYLLPAQKEIILSNIQPLKTLTAEVTFLDPIFKAIRFGVLTRNFSVSQTDVHVLEVVKRKTNQRSLKSIQQEVASIFKTQFNPLNIKLGSTFNYAELVSALLSIDGVLKLRTRSVDTDLTFEGLSFYLWNPVYPELDKQAIANNLTLNEFELMYFENLLTIESNIVVVEEI